MNMKIMTLSLPCMGYCVGYFCITVTKELSRSSSKEERSIWQGKAFHGKHAADTQHITVDQDAQSWPDRAFKGLCLPSNSAAGPAVRPSGPLC